MQQLVKNWSSSLSKPLELPIMEMEPSLREAESGNDGYSKTAHTDPEELWDWYGDCLIAGWSLR